MNKHLRFLFVLFFLMTFTSSVLAYSDYTHQNSYRYISTGNLFKSEMDRLSDNPAYVGAKLDDKLYLDYSKSPTREKTNIYTGLTGINSDNRFLLGGSSTVSNMLGVGALVEFGYNRTPQGVNTGAINTDGYASGSFVDSDGNQFIGSGEIQESTFYDTDNDSIYDTNRSLSAKRDSYNYQNNLNAKVVAGGYKIADFLLGISIERITDGSGKSESNSKYSYSRRRLADNYTLFAEKNNAKSVEEVIACDYNFNVGATMPLNDMILEGIFFFNLLQYQTKDSNSESNISTVTDNMTSNEKYLEKETNTQDGFETGFVAQVRMNILEFASQPYFSFTFGGLAPYKSGESIYKPGGTNYSNTYYGNPDHIDSQSEVSKHKYSGSGIQQMDVGLGIKMRKRLKENLLLGFGLDYNYLTSVNEYNDKYSYVNHRAINDGDGINEYDDYTLTRTGSYKDKFKVETLTHSVEIPVGLEYYAIDTLCLRLGVIHYITLTYTNTTVSRSGISALYDDYDHGNINGDETDYDGLASPTSSYNTRGRKENTKRYSQDNVYSFGIGYTMGETVQFDIGYYAGDASPFNRVDSRYAYMSSTFIIN